MSNDPAPRPWTNERIARLGFLVGLGWDGERVARDPIINSTHNNVHKQAQRFGLSFRVAAHAIVVPHKSNCHMERAARKRGISRDELIQRLLSEIAADPNLINNILDDDAEAAA
jgi:hypothetical protein